MKKVLTGDGSYTLFSEEYKEVYHSISGAEEEAVKKYVEPTGVFELAKKGFINVLDVCFGIGYNSAAVIDAALKSNPDCKIIIVGLEKDEKLLDVMKELSPSFESYKMIRDIRDCVYKNPNVDIKIVFGDARDTIKNIEEGFDICLFDPFSPKTQPEMWTETFFKDIASKMKVGGVLSTYSCATHVRINLVRAGFDPKDGPSIGRRAPSTIAIKI
ncbi:MAG: hypothetical protein KJ583_06150 [Nanoarchaeota archaeon]|nr:hypothetical protein [Nanoarchaeota archaeon]MBU1269589.1 hypothetical protein [Nanoarchaeota archaeon]MBU1604867.1 hypothetical protein [Nanoarchaeota archaeon]MBU2442473.1 hypothetical protein [Nanoarchaeota archaeon]